MPAQMTTIRSDRGLGFPWPAAIALASTVVGGGVTVWKTVQQKKQQQKAKDFRERQQLRKSLKQQARQMASTERTEAAELSSARARAVVHSHAADTFERAADHFRQLSRDLGDREPFARRMAETVRQARIQGAQEALQEGQLMRAVAGGVGALFVTGAIITISRQKR
jgi:YesN/AraC family two-component response regulator